MSSNSTVYYYIFQSLQPQKRYFFPCWLFWSRLLCFPHRLSKTLWLESKIKLDRYVSYPCHEELSTYMALKITIFLIGMFFRVYFMLLLIIHHEGFDVRSITITIQTILNRLPIGQYKKQFKQNVKPATDSWKAMLSLYLTRLFDIISLPLNQLCVILVGAGSFTWS